MLTIDGSFGEGGGQILRSSLALSMVTGTPFRIEKIRAGRAKPGLMRQHLTAVRAATKICNAKVRGDEVGSTELVFEPRQVIGGEYSFSIGTAGSTTLVLQTVLLPLLIADKPSHLAIEGGTHNPHAPPFDFLAKAYLPLLERMGARIRASLERPGFFPAGGGRIVVDVDPTSSLCGFDLVDRGQLRRRKASAMIANLLRHIAERETKVVSKRLGWTEDEVEIVEIDGAPGPGNIVTLALEYAQVTEVFTGFGEVGRAAEAVAMHAVQQCQRYLKGSAPVGEHLTDQLMLPMAIAGSGEFLSTGLSRHAETHIELIHCFLPVRIELDRQESGEAVVRFAPGDGHSRIGRNA